MQKDLGAERKLGEAVYELLFENDSSAWPEEPAVETDNIGSHTHFIVMCIHVIRVLVYMWKLHNEKQAHGLLDGGYHIQLHVGRKGLRILSRLRCDCDARTGYR